MESVREEIFLFTTPYPHNVSEGGALVRKLVLDEVMRVETYE